MKKLSLSSLCRLTVILYCTWLLTGIQTAQAQCPLSSFSTGASIDPVCGTYEDRNAGSGTYTPVNVVLGTTYEFSTCGSPFNTQLTGYQGGTSVFFNNINGPVCIGQQASVRWLASFTGTVRVMVNRANCQGHDFTGQSAVLRVKELEPQITFVGVSNISCNGQSDGGATASVNLGSAVLSYAWSNGSTGASISGVPAGTYDVTVTDFSACSSTASVTITEPDVLSGTINATDASCANADDGSLDLSVLGGTAPYSYNWSNGAISQDQTNLTDGSYSVTITDVNGCSATASASIAEPTPLVAGASSTNVSCAGANDGTVDLSVSGGTPAYSFAWSNGETTEDLPGVGAGTYTVTVTDANGCTATATATVTAPPALSAIATATPVTCNGDSDGSVDLTATGGTTPYTFQWSNGEITEDLSDISGGTYTVTVTDANGCTVSAEATVSEPLVLTAAETVSDYNGFGVSCNGAADGTITITPAGGNGGNTILWNDGNTDFSRTSLPAEIYTYTVEDSKGCSVNGTITITEPDSLTSFAVAPAFVGGTNISCFGGSDGSIDVTVNGGTTPYSFAWSNSETTEDISGLTAGTYNYTVTDANGCTIVGGFTLTEPNELVLTGSPFEYVGGNNVSCNGAADGSIDISIVGGTAAYSYVWSNGATTEDVSGLTAGTYDVVVTDANGCIAIDTFTLTEPVELLSSTSSPTFVGGNNVSCNGAADGSIDLTVSGGITPYAFSWSNGETTEDLSGITAGTYGYTVVDTNGCTSTGSITLTEPDALVTIATPFEYNGGVNISCNGEADGSIDLSVSGGITPYGIAWSTGETTEDISGLTAGTYGYTVVDTNGCSADGSVTLVEPDVFVGDAGPDTVAYFGFGPLACPQLTARDITGGTMPYSYAWSNGATTDTTTVCPDSTATYTVVVTDANGCSFTDSLTVEVIDVQCAGGGANPGQGKGKGKGQGNKPPKPLDKVLVCKIPPGNPSNFHEICIDSADVMDHLNTGSTLGECPAIAPKVNRPISSNDMMLKVYPNPTAGDVILRYADENQAIDQVRVYNMLGEIVWEQYLGESQNRVNLNLDITNNADGIYFMVLTNGNNRVAIEKVVKQRN